MPEISFSVTIDVSNTMEKDEPNCILYSLIVEDVLYFLTQLLTSAERRALSLLRVPQKGHLITKSTILLSSVSESTTASGRPAEEQQRFVITCGKVNNAVRKAIEQAHIATYHYARILSESCPKRRLSHMTIETRLYPKKEGKVIAADFIYDYLCDLEMNDFKFSLGEEQFSLLLEAERVKASFNSSKTLKSIIQSYVDGNTVTAPIVDAVASLPQTKIIEVVGALLCA